MNETIERLQIRSYFSIETDLASMMSDWPEFVTGAEYDVELRDSTNNEIVTTRFIQTDEECHVAISSSGTGSLFERVVGRTIYAMSAHSDDLMVERLDR
jgi:hypothetical protein